MLLQTDAQAGEEIAQIILPQSKLRGDLGRGIRIVIPTEKDVPITYGQLRQESINTLSQCPQLRLPFYRITGCNAVGQLLQRKSDFVAATLCASSGAVSIKGEIASDPTQKGAQTIGLFRRDRIPRPQPSIIDTLLRIGKAVQYVGRNRKAICAVLGLSLGNGSLVSLIIQDNDLAVFHVFAPFC